MGGKYGMDRKLGFRIRLWGTIIVVLAAVVVVWNYFGKNIYIFFAEHVGSVREIVREVMTEEEGVTNIEKVNYHKEGVEASYPRILSGGSTDVLNQWNRLIKEDFDKIIQIYSFQPFPGPTPSSTDVVPIILTITYEVKANTDSWLSLFYLAEYNSAYAAHPSNLIYTTNIDKKGERRLRLTDIAKLNEDFIKDFRTWKLKDASVESDVQEAIYEYINHISTKDLLTGFRAADNLGSDNPWGIYSYLTKDSLGISIEVPNYAGDHAEFEQSLETLKTKGLLQND
jgi:hypothetical protein